jgi:hypothetical protein
MFVSYKPERFSTNLKYPYRLTYKHGLCKNYGYPYGQHLNTFNKKSKCPTKESIYS